MSVLRTGVCATAAAALLSGASVAAATSFYVSPTGTTKTAAGTGTITNPWALATALARPAVVHPGDTIWLRGGTYRGNFTSYVTGTAANPVVVRAYPGERVTLDGGRSPGGAVLSVNGAFAWFWGFEVMSSDPDRTSTQSTSWPTDIGPGDGIVAGAAPSAGLKFVNLVVHDTAGGFSAFSTWSDTEIYGCLVYYNGWNGPDRGNGHGLYVQNQIGAKRITDNIVFHQFSHGLHAYTENGYLDNITAEGNTFFVNGDLAISGRGRNLLIGGLKVAQNPNVTSNFLYNVPANAGVSSFDLGYSAGCSNPRVVDNYVADNTYFVNCGGGVRTGNTFAGQLSGFTPAQFPNNAYILPPARPTGVHVFVRPNLYEPGRAHVTVFNWPLQSSVSVDLSGVLVVGTRFEVRNAQNFFGAPIVTGTYAGGSVTLPMTGLAQAAPIGVAAPSATGPEFNVFVILTVPGSPNLTPTPTATPTRTRTRTPTRPPTPTVTALPVTETIGVRNDAAGTLHFVVDVNGFFS